MKTFLIKERLFIRKFIVGLSILGMLCVSLAFGNTAQSRVFDFPLDLRKAPSAMADQTAPMARKSSF